MIFSENRYPLFGIMLWAAGTLAPREPQKGGFLKEKSSYPESAAGGRGARLGRSGHRPVTELRHDASSAPPAEEARYGHLDPRSDLLSLAAHRDAGAGRDARLCGGVRPRAQETGRHRGRRRRSEIVVLFQDRRDGVGAQHRRRVSPFRLERLLVVPVPADAASRSEEHTSELQS